MPNVYVLNNRFDFSKADQYGKLVLLTAGNFSRFSTSHLARVLKARLKDSSPEDYIVVSPLSVMNIVACAIFVLKHKRLNLLIFKTEEAGDHSFVERVLDLSDLEC